MSTGILSLEDGYTLGWDSASHNVILKLNGATVSALSIVNLVELHDVDIANLTDGDVITWVAADNKWENKPGHP